MAFSDHVDLQIFPKTTRIHTAGTAPLPLQTPRRWYSYKVAHDDRILRFQAPPPAGREEGFQFLVYGDMGDPDHRQAKAPGCASSLGSLLHGKD